MPPEHRHEAIQAFIQNKYAQISVSRTRHRGSIGAAEWLADKRLARISKKKGSFGFKKDGVFYLTPFQTLSVIESHEFEVTRNGLPLSMEEAFAICLTSEAEMDEYRVYSSLIRQGVRVWQPDVAISYTGDARTKDKTFSSQSKRDNVDEEPIGACTERKRRRKNSAGSLSPTGAAEMLQVTNLRLSDVRHREYVVPPIHEYLKSNAKNWTQYKEMTCCLDQDFAGRVIDLSHGLSDGVSQQLPSSVLSSGLTQCVHRFEKIQSFADLCSSLQNAGPTTFCSQSDDTTAKVSLHFETEEGEKGDVMIRSINDGLPSPQSVDNLSRKRLLILAVVDQSLLSFFRFSSLHTWDRLPRLWLKHVH